MIKKSIKYIDYNGNEREEDFYFNLSKAETAELELSIVGGLKQQIEKAVKDQNGPLILKMFKEIVLKAYGEKSADGRRFMKSEEITRNFAETEAYVELFMELATDEAAAKAFMEGVLPKPETK